MWGISYKQCLLFQVWQIKINFHISPQKHMLLVLKKKRLNETVLFVLTDASENDHILKLK